jgi:hypothetical protein
VASSIDFDFSRWPYPLYKEVTEKLYELAKNYPNLTHLQSIGKSVEGRELWVLKITNSKTGPGESKPGLWLDSNIHANEVNGRQLLMYFAERILASYGSSPEVTRLVDSRTFYLLPMFDVDGGERALTRHPSWPGHKPVEHAGKDLDGDGFITSMRVKDPEGVWYQSSADPRIMLRIRDRTGGRWNYVPTVYSDRMFFNWQEPDIGWKSVRGEPQPFDDPLAPKEQRYSIYVEGVDVEENVTVEREQTNFNRNWSAEWQPHEVGSGPFPFSQPEVRAVADFIVSHKNIFFVYTIHSDDTGKNYLVRPPMTHPYEWMPPEDNEFYVRVGSQWSMLSGGGIIENNWYSQEVMTGSYGITMVDSVRMGQSPNWKGSDTDWIILGHGFMNDWAYMQQGIHALLPETARTSGRDYNNDGYIGMLEVLRWSDEEKGGEYYAEWKPYDHPVLGEVEIGGARAMPPCLDEKLREKCRAHYDFVLFLADLAPELRIREIQTEELANGHYQVTAVLQNTGYLSTYVTRNALRVRRDYPILARINLDGGEVVEGEVETNTGHILGRHAYLWRWTAGADEGTKRVSWTVRKTGASPLKISVTTSAHKAGRDSKTITISE